MKEKFNNRDERMNEKKRAIERLKKYSINSENIDSAFVIERETDKDGLKSVDVQMDEKAEITWVR